MKFTTPCFVRVEDVEKRKELVEWLEWIGYRYCVGCVNARSAISSPLIPYVGVSSRAETGFVECFLQCPEEGMDCGENIELFKALAAMNDENDHYQWFVATLKPERLVLNNSMDDNRLFAEPLFRKATAEEIIEYFNRKLI